MTAPVFLKTGLHPSPVWSSSSRRFAGKQSAFLSRMNALISRRMAASRSFSGITQTKEIENVRIAKDGVRGEPVLLAKRHRLLPAMT